MICEIRLLIELSQIPVLRHGITGIWIPSRKTLLVTINSRLSFWNASETAYVAVLYASLWSQNY